MSKKPPIPPGHTGFAKAVEILKRVNGVISSKQLAAEIRASDEKWYEAWYQAARREAGVHKALPGRQQIRAREAVAANTVSDTSASSRNELATIKNTIAAAMKEGGIREWWFWFDLAGVLHSKAVVEIDV